MYSILSIAELNTAYRMGQTTPPEVIDGVLKAILEFNDEKTWIYRVPDEELYEKGVGASRQTPKRSPTLRHSIRCKG